MSCIKTVLLVAATLLCFIVSAEAHFPRGNGATSPECVKTNAFADDCSNAAGTVRFTDMLTSSVRAAGSGMVFTTQAPWNIAGVDSSEGVHAATLLLDPATATMPSGCSWAPKAAHWATITGISITGSIATFTLNSGATPVTGEQLTFNSGTQPPANTHLTTNIDTTHWNIDTTVGGTLTSTLGYLSGGPQLTCDYADFSLSALEMGPIGGHAATVLQVGTHVPTSASLSDLHFFPDTNTTNATAQGINAFGINGGTYAVNVDHVTLDGNCYSSTCGIQYGIVMYNTGTTTFKHTAVINQPGRPITAGCPSTSANCTTMGDFDVENNLFYNFQMTANGTHGEPFERIGNRNAVGSMGTYTYRNNTIIQGNQPVDGTTTALIYMSSGGADYRGPRGQLYPHSYIDHNTLITNANAGAPAGPITSTILEFDSGEFQDLHINDNYIGRGANWNAGQKTSLYTFQCEGAQADITASVNGTTGLVTVTAWSGVTGNTLTNVGAGQELWVNGVGFSGVHLTSQITGSPVTHTLTNASISGSVLHYDSASPATTNSSNAIAVGDIIAGPGITVGTRVASWGSIPGNTYNLTLADGVTANTDSVSGITATSNTSGQVGTYASSYTGADIASASMKNVGGYRDVIIQPGQATLANNTDMVTNTAIANAFEPYRASCPLP